MFSICTIAERRMIQCICIKHSPWSMWGRQKRPWGSLNAQTPDRAQQAGNKVTAAPRLTLMISVTPYRHMLNAADWLEGCYLLFFHTCVKPIRTRPDAGCCAKTFFKKKGFHVPSYTVCFLQTEEQAWKFVFHSKQNDNLNRDSALLIVFVSKSLWHTAEQQKYTLFLWELHLSYLHHFVFLWRLQGNKWKWE